MKIIIYIFILFSVVRMNSVNAQATNWQWAASGGGITTIIGNGISVDSSGNSYVTGMFFTGTMILGNITLTNTGSSFDFFMAKFDPAGNVIWAKSAGGDSYDEGLAISNDGNGNVYVTGFFQSPEIDFGGITLFNPDSVLGNENYFIAKFNTDGNVSWAKSVGRIQNHGNIQGNDIRTDGAGNSYVTGDFGVDTMRFDTITLVNSDPFHSDDLFVAKYDSSGNVMWAKRAGPTYVGESKSITIDNLGNSYIVGDYNVGPGINFENINLPGSGNFDIFLAKYDPNGNVIWAKKIGGSDRDFGRNVSVDGDENIYVTGHFLNDTLMLGSDTLRSKGDYDAFVAKYDSSGSVLWARAIAGQSAEYCLGVSVDPGGYIFLTGAFQSSLLIVGNDTLANRGGLDIYIAKFNNAGTILWAQDYGGTGDDYCTDITNDATGSIYITGVFASDSITFGTHTILNSIHGGIDIFVAKQNGVVGIDEIKNKNTFVVYPNPAHDVLNILMDKNIVQGRVNIFNVMGENVYSEQISGRRKSIYRDLSPGIYFISVTDGITVYTRKFIIE